MKSLTNTSANHALLIDAVCTVYGIPVEILNMKCRNREWVNARQMLFKVARDHFSMTFSEIGKVLFPLRRNFDHTTVMHGCKVVSGLLHVEDHETTEKYKSVMSYITERTMMDATITISLKMEEVNRVLLFLNAHNLNYELTAHVI